MQKLSAETLIPCFSSFNRPSPSETVQSLPAFGASTGQRSWQHRLSDSEVAAPLVVTLKKRSAWLGLGLGIGVGLVMEGSRAAAYKHFHLRASALSTNMVATTCCGDGCRLLVQFQR